MIRFIYHGEAVGKGRPRYSKRGDYVHTYTPKKTKDFEDALRFEFMASNCEAMPVYDREIPLQMKVTIGVSIPKSYSKKKHALCRDRMLVPTGKPDLDNCIKSIADSLNGACYADDAQLVKIYAERFYAEEPFVEVEIDELR